MTDALNPLSDAQLDALNEVDMAGDTGVPYGNGLDKIHWKTGTFLAEVGLVHIEAGEKAAGQDRMVTITDLGRAYLADDADAHRQVADAMWERSASTGDEPRQVVAGVDPADVVGGGSHRTTPGAGHRTVLSEFDGQDVLSATISVRNAGDGLSAAMAVEPIELHHGQVVHVVLECEVDKITFAPIKDTEGLQRVHVLKAGRATLIDADQVERALDEQEEKIEAASGVQRLPFPADDEGSGSSSSDEAPEEEDTLAVLAELEGAGPEQPDDEDDSSDEAPF